MQTGKQKRVYHDVTEQIQKLLKSNQLQVGDRLPPERQLAELFRVSRNSVREAIKSLEQHGILISRPGAGTFIAANLNDLSTELHKVMLQERHRLADIFELRLILEPQIAQLASERITPAGVQKLLELIDGQERSDTALDARQFDLAFHQHIAASTGNQAIMRLMEHLNDLLAESRDEALQSVSRRAESLSGHKRIVAALARQDGEASSREMATHLLHIQNYLFEPEINEVCDERNS